MDFNSYFNKKKELNEIIVSFCTYDDESDSASRSKRLIDFIEKEKIRENIEELRIFIRIFSKIVSYHHRPPNFISKIKEIFSFLAESIKQNFSSLEMYNLFKENKLLLQILLDLKIVTVSNYIKNNLRYQSYNDKTKYYHFLYPELKDHLKEEDRKRIEKELNDIDQKILPDFTQKLQEGENDSKLCQIIRQDSVNEFVVYINQQDLNPQYKVFNSLFETNQFLIEKSSKPTIIEYAAFFGATQIIEYLQMTGCKMNQSLYNYAIHSNNISLIIFLLGIIPISNFEEVLRVSIQCHHNEIANLFLKKIDEIDEKKLINYCFEYDNFAFLPENFESDKDFIFSKLCEFNSPTLVRNFLSKNDLSQKSIENGFYDAFNRNQSPKYDYTYDIVKILAPKIGQFGQTWIHEILDNFFIYEILKKNILNL